MNEILVKVYLLVLIVICAVDIVLMCLIRDNYVAVVVVLGVSVTLYTVFLVLINNWLVVSGKLVTVVSYFLVFYHCAVVFVLQVLPRSDTAAGLVVDNAQPVSVAMFFVYMTYVMLPLQYRSCVVSSLLITLTYLVTNIATNLHNNNNDNNSAGIRITANVLLMIAVNIAGIFALIPTDQAQKRAFLDTRSYVENRLKLQKEIEKQDNLLLSVLPRYVAMEMKADIEGEQQDLDMQFSKIYIQRHINVSNNV